MTKSSDQGDRIAPVHRRWPHVLMLMATVSGCGMPPEDGPDQEIEAVPRAATAFNLNNWQRRPMPLRICTSRDPSLSGTAYPIYRGWMFSILTASWGRAGLSFTDSGECTSNFDVQATFFGNGFFGRCSATGNCKISGDNTVTTTSQQNIQGISIHEFGHGLGLAHEHQRPGAPPLCTREQNILDTCTRCSNAAAVPMPCAAADYNGCFLKAVTTPQMLTPEEKVSARDRINDRTIDNTAKVLATYDPRSVMNYCGDVNGRPPLVDLLPTSLDLLSMEMLYPTNHVYRVGCSAGCLYTPDGVIVRSDGAVTSEWTGRGALNVSMTFNSFTGTSVPASQIPNGTTSFSYTFLEPRGTTRSGSGIVHKNDGLHTALVASLRLL
jgi:hypothetical protein